MNKMLYAVCSLALAALMVFRTSKEEVHSFVQQRDGQFLIGRQPYKFVGTNFWYGAILGSEGQGGDRQRLCRELDNLHALGLDNLRILVGSDGEHGVRTKVEPTLQRAPGVYNDTILAGLDFLLMEMGKRGMKAVLYLNNSWEWSGGYGFYLEHAGAGRAPRPNEDGYPAFMKYVAQFATNGRAHLLFYQYIKFILSRTNRYTGLAYKDDPTIMAWQVGNEPRAFGNAEKQPFAQWLAESTALIRSLDSHHLISIGSEGIWGCEMGSRAIAGGRRAQSMCQDGRLPAAAFPLGQTAWQAAGHRGVWLSARRLPLRTGISHRGARPLLRLYFLSHPAGVCRGRLQFLGLGR